jgi:hypothetical protein
MKLALGNFSGAKNPGVSFILEKYFEVMIYALLRLLSLFVLFFGSEIQVPRKTERTWDSFLFR